MDGPTKRVVESRSARLKRMAVLLICTQIHSSEAELYIKLPTRKDNDLHKLELVPCVARKVWIQIVALWEISPHESINFSPTDNLGRRS